MKIYDEGEHWVLIDPRYAQEEGHLGSRRKLYIPKTTPTGPWTFNGDLESPTINPSYLMTWGEGGTPKVNHFFITDGKVCFLTDSTHQWAGQDMDIPHLTEEEFEYLESLKRKRETK